MCIVNTYNQYNRIELLFPDIWKNGVIEIIVQ